MCYRTLLMLVPLVVGTSALAQQPKAPSSATPPASYGQQPKPTSSGQMSTGENCGTPDEPKPCPPLPRHPLKTYPANRS